MSRSLIAIALVIANQIPGLAQPELDRRQKMALSGGLDGLQMISLSTYQSEAKKEIAYSLLS